MVIAIHTERSYANSGQPEVHFTASLIEPGVSVGYCILRNKRFRCFLIFIHFIFCLRGNRQFFHSYTPQQPLWPLPFGGWLTVAHCLVCHS